MTLFRLVLANKSQIPVKLAASDNIDLEIAIDRIFSDQGFELEVDLEENEKSRSTAARQQLGGDADTLIIRAAVGMLGASLLIHNRPLKHFAFRGVRLSVKAGSAESNRKD